MGRSRKKGRDIHGWINFDKPKGMTSTQAVGKVRWLFQAKKAGHAGTLDPLADGILPIALGEATKTVPFLQERGKTYRFTLKWGAQTSTLDAEGEVVLTSDVRPSKDDILAALPGFTGEIMQVPPKFSAIKVDGARAYDLARAGEEVKLKARPVTVRRLELIKVTSEDEAVFEMDCGKGTYVRSIARDLAQALGTAGHVTQLRRTRVGPFCEKESISLALLEDLVHKQPASGGLQPVETALDDIPVFAIDDHGAFDLKQGRAVVLLPDQAQHLRAQARDRIIGELDASRYVLVMTGDTALGLCDARAGRLYPKRVFQINDTI